jgi:hypothetical protein
VRRGHTAPEKFCYSGNAVHVSFLGSVVRDGRCGLLDGFPDAVFLQIQKFFARHLPQWFLF